jgi:hypothetical protein
MVALNQAGDDHAPTRAALTISRPLKADGQPDNDRYKFDNHDFIAATPCLGWSDGGDGSHTLYAHKLEVAFLPAARPAELYSMGADHATDDRLAFDAALVIETGFEPAAWERWLNMLIKNGLVEMLESAADPPNGIREAIASTISGLKHEDLDALTIRKADLVRLESFDSPRPVADGALGRAGGGAPAAAPARRRRPRRGANTDTQEETQDQDQQQQAHANDFETPAGRDDSQAARDGPERMRFLARAKMGSFITVESPAQPLAGLADFLGLLGPRGTRASRLDDAMQVVLAAEQLRGGLLKHLGFLSGQAPTDGLLVSKLPDFVRSLHLPPLLCEAGMDDAMLQRALSDGIAWAHGAEADMRRVERQRLPVMIAKLAPLASLLGSVPDPAEQTAIVEELNNTWFPTRLTAPLHLRLPEIAVKLEQRESVIQGALSAGKSAKDVAAALGAEEREYASSALGAAGKASFPALDTPGTGAGGQPTTIRDAALHRALNTPSFVATDEAIAACDLQTGHGQRQAVSHAFGSGDALIVRFMLNMPSSLRDRSELLGKLESCRNERLPYISECQVVDAATGKVPTEVAEWVWSAAGFEKLCRCQIGKIDWCNKPDGFLGIKELQTCQPWASVTQHDALTTQAALEGAGDHAHRTLVAIGWANVSSHGYTMRTLYDFHIAFCNEALSMAGAERDDWLNFAREQFQRALDLVGEEMYVRLNSAEPGRVVLDFVLPFECAYACNLNARREAIRNVALMRRALPSCWPRAATPITLPGIAAPAPTPRPAPQATRGAAEAPPAKRSKFDTGPGSQANLAFWMKQGELLIIAYQAFNVRSLAKELNVSVASKCWPVLCSNKYTYDNEGGLALCPQVGNAGHKHMSSLVHVRPPGWTSAVLAKHSRAATAAERAAYAAHCGHTPA